MTSPIVPHGERVVTPVPSLGVGGYGYEKGDEGHRAMVAHYARGA
jgi:hypothetical protein